MNFLDAGTSGTYTSVGHPNSWHELGLAKIWADVASCLSSTNVPRPIQSTALGQAKILESRRNLIVSAPTNSGKSLVGYLVLLQAAAQGKRAILLEPLRAIAREKADELISLSPRLEQLLGCLLRVTISTGDYRLDDESMSSPPRGAEIVIATAERFDSILRNPKYADWITSIGAVCIDEAHLISSPPRGSILEYVITSLLCLAAPPRLCLLSATVGDTAAAQNWLDPCDVVAITERIPPLRKEVIELAADESANDVVVELARRILLDTAANLLIFVYQTKSAENLANRLQAEVVSSNALGYHSQMNSDQRNRVRAAFVAGQTRCVVTTTALGLGVNLPATHVIVRDASFPGIGRLSVAELLQMMGRAGRGSTAGQAVVLVRVTDGWAASELAAALRTEKLPDLVSCLEPITLHSRQLSAARDDRMVPIATQIASFISRFQEQGVSVENLNRFFQRSLGAKALTAQTLPVLEWLGAPGRTLIYRDEHERYHLTVLGLKAVHAALPLTAASGFGQLIRDLLTIDPTDKLLEKWQPLDHLIVLSLLHTTWPRLRVFSARLVKQVDAWMERNSSHVPLLYKEWIAGTAVTSRAAEIAGSLGMSSSNSTGDRSDWAYRQCYLAAFRSIILFERGRGVSLDQLDRTWDVNGLDGIEERWRDETLWLLTGLGDLLDLRSFYFHLREECVADTERIQRVKRVLQHQRQQVLQLREHIKYCSPLGPILRSLQHSKEGDGATVGLVTLRRLENAGIASLAQLSALNVQDLRDLGVRSDLARQIVGYARRRAQ